MPPERITQDMLFCGDKLRILYEYVADERIGVIAWGLRSAAVPG